MVSKWVLIYLYMVYIEVLNGFNPLTNLLLTPWDIQVCHKKLAEQCEKKTWHDIP